MAIVIYIDFLRQRVILETSEVLILEMILININLMRTSLKEVLLLLFLNQKRQREINRALSVIFYKSVKHSF